MPSRPMWIRFRTTWPMSIRSDIRRRGRSSSLFCTRPFSLRRQRQTESRNRLPLRLDWESEPPRLTDSFLRAVCLPMIRRPPSALREKVFLPIMMRMGRFVTRETAISPGHWEKTTAHSWCSPRRTEIRFWTSMEKRFGWTATALLPD